MKSGLKLSLLLSFLFGCESDEVGSSVSPCCYKGGNMIRDQFVKEMQATIVVDTLPSGEINYNIARGGTSAALASCKMPAVFAKDGLKVTVSGYLLTFPGLEYVNLSPLPFEVTDIKLRQ